MQGKKCNKLPIKFTLPLTTILSSLQTNSGSTDHSHNLGRVQ